MIAAVVMVIIGFVMILGGSLTAIISFRFRGKNLPSFPIGMIITDIGGFLVVGGFFLGGWYIIQQLMPILQNYLQK